MTHVYVNLVVKVNLGPVIIMIFNLTLAGTEVAITFLLVFTTILKKL